MKDPLQTPRLNYKKIWFDSIAIQLRFRLDSTITIEPNSIKIHTKSNSDFGIAES